MLGSGGCRRSYVVVWQAVRFPAQSSRHLGEAFRLDEVVEGEWREHGAVAVDVCFYEKSGATHTVKVNDLLLVAIGI